MHPRVSVSAICTFQWPLDRDLELYARAGITNVGVSVAKLEAFGFDEGVARVADAGLRVDDLIGVRSFDLEAPERWPQQRDRLVRCIDAAVTLGAPAIVFTTGPAGTLTWEEAADRLEEAVGEVLAHARSRGVRFAIEHTNPLRVDVGFVHTLADVVDLAHRLDAGVCMETNACWAERGLARTVRDHVDRIALVQVSDYRVGTHSTPNRFVPGDGVIPFRRILGELLDAGYGGVFDLELIGPAIEAEGYESAVPRSVAALGAILDELGA